MKFQIPSIHRSKVSNFTEKWKNQSNFQNSIFLSKFDREFSKVDQVIYSSALTCMRNMKALAQILFEVSCTQDFQILFSKGHNSEKGHNSDMKKLEDHWSCSSPERLSHCKLMRFKLIENRPMKVYAWTLLTPRGMAKFDPGA